MEERGRQRHKAGLEKSGRMRDITSEKYKRNMGQLDLKRGTWRGTGRQRKIKTKV